MKRSDAVKEFLILLFILIISVFFIFDLLLQKGQPTTFDGPTHVANIAQVYGALRDGEFPGRWGGGFARYGMPIPIIAQQTTSYLGAVLTFFTGNVWQSYVFVIWIALFISAYLMYIFLRMHTSRIASLSGAFLFMFAPYRIMNVYIRGALPELFASVFILAILITLTRAVRSGKLYWYVLTAVGVGALLLTHPFMIVVAAILLLPYSLYLLSKISKKRKLKILIGLLCSGVIGVALSSYFLLPLVLEIKYFYYGSSGDHFVPGHFLSIWQYFQESWYYFNKDIATRAHYHLGGSIEGIIVIVGVLTSATSLLSIKKIGLLHVISFIGLIYILLTLPFSEPLYKSIPLLGNVQHPWRMLTGYMLVPPMIFAILVENISFKRTLVAFMIVVIAFLRFPQLYGKNYTDYSQNSFFVTDYNLHGQIMNTVWMGRVSDYPYKKYKAEIIEGRGRIISSIVKNASRNYEIQANTELRLVDYTFYYPGWKVFVDGMETNIEFQDPKYRGVITYKVTKGKHKVSLKFTETKVRKLGNLITIVSGLTIIGLLGLSLSDKKKYIL